jgi:hypothetical protein
MTLLFITYYKIQQAKVADDYTASKSMESVNRI